MSERRYRRRYRMIYKYTFEDGTVLSLLDVGLSCAEIWALEKLHGKCKIERSEVSE